MLFWNLDTDSCVYVGIVTVPSRWVETGEGIGRSVRPKSPAPLGEISSNDILA